jgi:hypothetical protein
MNSKRAWKLGDDQGFDDAKRHPVLIGVLHGICIIIALSLPVTWYWRIAAFFAMGIGMGFVRMVLWPALRGRRGRKEAEAAALRIIGQAEAEYQKEMDDVLARLSEAADEGVRREAELQDIEANGTPEEKAWVADLRANFVVTPEEAQRRADAPSPSARIERYRAECAAYNAAHASRHEDVANREARSGAPARAASKSTGS